MNYDEFDWDEFLHRASVWGGVIMAIVSIWFSYDGLDQTVVGGNPAYTEIAKAVGIIMAIIVTLVQFVFNTDIRKLTTTLIIGGIISYIYSMTTNYLGINHLFGFHGFVGGMIAFFWDALPEALIAWGLRDTSNGDMIRNMFRGFMGFGGKSEKKSKNVFPQETRKVESNFSEQRHVPSQHSNPPKRGKGRAHWMNPQPNKPIQPEKPNRFDMFGE